MDGYTEREDLGGSIEEVHDDGARGEVMNSNSGEENEAVADVVLEKKRRGFSLENGKNNVSAPKRDGKRSGSQLSQNDVLGLTKA